MGISDLAGDIDENDDGDGDGFSDPSLLLIITECPDAGTAGGADNDDINGFLGRGRGEDDKDNVLMSLLEGGEEEGLMVLKYFASSVSRVIRRPIHA